jgi:4-amino-4-deoxy-L-arabinose transferase-like glycosyltransferase
MRPGSRFARDLALIGALAFAVRLVYALIAAPGLAVDDDSFFHLTADALAAGHGYVQPFELDLHGISVPTAEHPILYPLVLSLVARAGGTGVDIQRGVGILAGTGVVVLVALLGRELAGARAGLIAAAIAALWPSLIAADGSIMSEPLYGLLVLGAVLLAVRHVRSPTLGGALGLGALIGLAGLTRSEGLALVILLALPAVLMAGRRRTESMIAVVAVAAVVMSPWVIRNWTTFDRPVLSTNEGTVVAGSNCHSTFYGADIGAFDFACVKSASRGAPSGNEAVRADTMRDAGVDYATDHAGRLPVVVAARVASLWGVFDPRRQFVVTGRDITVQKAGVILFYPLAILAIGGAVALWRRRQRAAILMLAPFVLVTFVGATTYGGVRLRHTADLMIVVLAGVAIDALLLRRRARAGDAGAASGRPASAGTP